MEGKTELQRNATQEARRKELESYQRALDVEWLDSRMDDGRMGRIIALIKREAEMEKDFQERTDHAAIVNARSEKETKLGLEVAKLKREEMCLLLRRHYLRERDPSIRELIKKLGAGYVSRDLKQQILHNEYRRLQEKAEENYANTVLQKALYSDKGAMEKEEKDKIDQSAQYCKELQQQLVSRQQQRQCEYEDTLIEKKMLEEVSRTLADEDQRELEKKRMETEKLRNEMVTFTQARKAWKDKQKEMIIIEERKIEQQRQAASDRNSSVIAERERKMQIKEDLNQKISAKILSDEEAHLERENIIKLLQEQEYLEKNFQDDLAEREKMIRVKKEMKEELTKQMESRRRDALKQKVVEAEFRKQTEAKIAADNEKEREKTMKMKEKTRQYSHDLRRQMEENARRRAVERQLEEARAAAVWDYQRDWRSEVAEERRKIVSEHAPRVLGSLQAGVLAREDLPALRAGAARSPDLGELDIEALSQSTGLQRRPKCNAQCRVLREY